MYSKELSAGERVTKTLYVDDGRYYWDDTPTAKAMAVADRASFATKFEVRYGDEDPLEDWFLGSNRVASSLGSCSIKCVSYIDQMVKRYAEGDVQLGICPGGRVSRQST